MSQLMFLFLALSQEYKGTAQKRDQSPKRMHLFPFPVCDIHGQEMKQLLSFEKLLLVMIHRQVHRGCCQSGFIRL